MSSPTNLTDRITHLRDRKDKIVRPQTNHSGKNPQSGKPGNRRERRFATDYFMLVAYSLLGFALLSQFFMIFWLDII